MSEELLKKCEKQEEVLQFTTFTQTDALKLGNMLYETSLSYDKPVAIEIRMNHLCVFRFFPAGTNENNVLWLKAKANTVDMLGISSLHLHYELEKSGETLEEKRMDPKQFTHFGGGFPLILKGSGVVGTIGVSGLEHTKDHQVIIDTLIKYLNIEDTQGL